MIAATPRCTESWAAREPPVRSWVLGSGSKGNAVLVEAGGERLLIDNGFGTRTIAGRLKALGVVPHAIGAVLVTHEHIDHSSGVAPAVKKWNWKVIASAGTLGAMRHLPAGRRIALREGESISFGAFDLLGVRVPHDATEPMGFVVTARATGARLGMATDLGEIPLALLTAFERLDVLILESNHDEEMLRSGPYPLFLKERILARTGHLSNAACGAALATLAHRGLTHVVLAHLSETNNAPDVARRSAAAALRRAGWRGTLRVASQDAPGDACGEPAAQLALPLLS